MKMQGHSIDALQPPEKQSLFSDFLRPYMTKMKVDSLGIA